MAGTARWQPGSCGDGSGCSVNTSLFSGSGPKQGSGQKHAIHAVCRGQRGWEQIHRFPELGHSSLRDFSGWISREADGSMQVKFISNAVSCQVVSYKSDPF